MYARWPGHFTAGGTDNRMVANVDLAPTIVDAVGGIAPGVPMDGRSLLDPLQNRTRILTEYEGQPTDFEQGWAALRTLTSHYVEHYAGDDRQRIVHREYYDLFADPFELDNLLADASSANDPNTAALSAQLAADRECVGSGLPIESAVADAARPSARLRTPRYLAILARHEHSPGEEASSWRSLAAAPGARRMRR